MWPKRVHRDALQDTAHQDTAHQDTAHRDTPEPAPPAGGYEVSRSEGEWRALLTPEQFRILRQAGTERAGTGRYAYSHDDGVYRCAACGQQLFDSRTKFDSGTGWPSFFQALPGAVETRKDRTFGMTRVEVRCRRCGSHLGHVFPDGPRPTGSRYCMNSAALKLAEREAHES